MLSAKLDTAFEKIGNQLPKLVIRTCIKSLEGGCYQITKFFCNLRMKCVIFVQQNRIAKILTIFKQDLNTLPALIV